MTPAVDLLNAGLNGRSLVFDLDALEPKPLGVAACLSRATASLHLGGEQGLCEARIELAGAHAGCANGRSVDYNSLELPPQLETL